MKTYIEFAALGVFAGFCAFGQAPTTTTVGADRPILKCPIEQKPAQNGAEPNRELLSKVFSCQYGEKPAAQGYDGAVTVDVISMQIGTRRLYDLRLDSGSGAPGKTFVYPVKVTFTNKTHYRTRTEVAANAIRIFNFFINSFGEWQYGSVELIKSAEVSSVPKAK